MLSFCERIVFLSADRLPMLAGAVKSINRMDFSLIKETLVSDDVLLCSKWMLLGAQIAMQYCRGFSFLK